MDLSHIDTSDTAQWCVYLHYILCFIIFLGNLFGIQNFNVISSHIFDSCVYTTVF